MLHSYSTLNFRASLTTFENLSNELLYEIFDYLGSIGSHIIFSKLNKRFACLLNKSPLPIILRISDFDRFDIRQVCRDFIVPHKERVRSIRFSGDDDIQRFYDSCYLDQTFTQLRSMRVDYVRSISIVALLLSLQRLPALSYLDLHISVIRIPEYFIISDVNQVLLQIESLEHLAISYSFIAFPHDEIYFGVCSSLFRVIPFIPNQKQSSLEYLKLKHAVTIEYLFSMLQYTPKLKILFVETIINLAAPLEQSTIWIPKVKALSKLEIGDWSMSLDDIMFMLDAFDCSLTRLKICHTVNTTCILHHKWKIFIKRRLSRLYQFSIELKRSSDGNNDYKFDIRTLIDFVADQYWYDHGWSGNILLQSDSIACSYQRSK